MQHDLLEIHPIFYVYLNFSFYIWEVVHSVSVPQYANLNINLVKDMWADSGLTYYT